LYKDGDIELSDLVERKQTEWGPSASCKSVKQLVADGTISREQGREALKVARARVSVAEGSGTSKQESRDMHIPLLTKVRLRSSMKAATAVLSKQKSGEIMVAFRGDKCVMEPRGVTGTRIELRDDELKDVKGATLLHNHPKGTSFSFDDAEMFVKTQAKELWAITPDRIFVLKRSTSEITTKKIAEQAAEHLGDIRNFVYSQMTDEGYNPLDDNTFLPELWKRVEKTKNSGIIYEEHSLKGK
jgi:hypothetical protein